MPTSSPFSSSELLEQRLSRLERDLKRQKRAFLALSVAAFVAVGATRAVSQNSSTPREVATQTLKIVGPDGRVRAFLSADPQVAPDGALLALLGPRGEMRATFTLKGPNAFASFTGARNTSRQPDALVGIVDGSGMVGLGASGGKTQVNLAANNGFSGLSLAGPNGRESFVLEADGSGSLLKMLDGQGRIQRQMP